MKKKTRQKYAPAKPDPAAPLQHPPATRTLHLVRLTILLVLLTLLAVIPYINTLSNNFALDDIPIIVQNPVIRDVANVRTIFTTHYWAKGEHIVKDTDPGLYRPLAVFTYAVDHAFWKLNAAGYHLSNLVLHAVTTLLVFLIAVDVLKSPMAAFTAASIFAVHPVHTEAVTGIVGRAEVLATLFFLLAFWFARPQAISGSPSKSRVSGLRLTASLGAAALFYLFGLFSKEIAITLPAVLLVYDWIHKEDFLTRSAKRTSVGAATLTPLISRYILFGMVVLVYFAFRSQAVKGRNIWVGFVAISTDERVFTASRVLMEYLGLLIFPHTLSADYWYPEVRIAGSPVEPLVLLSLLLWATLGVIAIYALRTAPALFFSMAFFFVTILPVSNLFFPIGVGKAERLLYLPSVGFCLGVGWGYGWLEKTINKKWLLLLPLVPILSVFAIRTYNRNPDWKDDLTLSLVTLKVSPTSPVMNHTAALEYGKLGQQDRAISLLQEAIRQRPEYPPYHFELGLAYYRKGLLDQAIEEFRQVITRQADHLAAHDNLGAVYFSKNQIDEAIQEFNSALRISPNHVSARNNLGNAYARKGLPDRAIEQYKQAISLRPDFSEAHINLAAVYIDKNQLDEAIKESSIALQINPNSAEAHNNLGTAYMRKGQLDKAVEQFQQAVRLKPDYPDAQNNLRAALQQKSQTEKLRQ